MILADMKIAGRTRKALVTFNKNGFQYTLDRATGEAALGSRLCTRDVGEEHRPEDRPSDRGSDETDRRVQRQREGHLPQPRRRSESRLPRRPIRRARNSSIPRPTICAWISRRRRASTSEALRSSAPERPTHAGPGGNLGTFMAWDAASGKKVWEVKEPYPSMERRAGDRGRRGVLRNARWMVQDGRRQNRQAAFEVQGGLGSRGQSDHVSRARTASNTSQCMPASGATGS